MKNAYQLTDDVKLLQKIVLIHDGKFLVLRRSPTAKTRANQWDLPGGNAMWPDSGVDVRNPNLLDLFRELSEETGFELSQTAHGSDLKLCHLSTYFEIKNQTYSIIAGYTLSLPAAIDPGKIQLSPEHTAWAWLTSAEMTQPKYDFGFAGGLNGFITLMVAAAFKN